MKFGKTVRAGAAAMTMLLFGCSSFEAPTATQDQPMFKLSADDNASRKVLQQLRDQARQRFKAEREARKSEFAAAKQSWEQFKREYKAAKKSGEWSNYELLRCEPKEYEGDAEVIGPEGGHIQVGTTELRIPKGALDHDVLITAEAPVSQLREVRFEPHGLQFGETVELELDYHGCVNPPIWENAFVAYLDDTADRVLQPLRSKDKKLSSSVVGELHHFSRYAVAY